MFNRLLGFFKNILAEVLTRLLLSAGVLALAAGGAWFFGGDPLAVVIVVIVAIVLVNVLV